MALSKVIILQYLNHLSFIFLDFFFVFLGLDEKSNENNKKEKKEKRKRKRGKMEGKQLRYDRGGEVTRWFAHLHKLGGG